MFTRFLTFRILKTWNIVKIESEIHTSNCFQISGAPPIHSKYLYKVMACFWLVHIPHTWIYSTRFTKKWRYKCVLILGAFTAFIKYVMERESPPLLFIPQSQLIHISRFFPLHLAIGIIKFANKRKYFYCITRSSSFLKIGNL